MRIEISDDGPGISEKDLPNIFDRFFRADASRNSAKRGSGLGLAIVKKSYLTTVEIYGQKVLREPEQVFTSHSKSRMTPGKAGIWFVKKSKKRLLYHQNSPALFFIQLNYTLKR